MTKLEDIKNGASVAGVVPNQNVEIVSVEPPFDQNAIQFSIKSLPERAGEPK